MPRATATVSFQAIELKGSLLPASLLEQVARLQAPMQKEADYGLAKGERLREQIDAAWVRLKEIWEEYRDLRKRAAQSIAGLHLAQRLLREVLGWTQLQPCSGWQHGDSHYPITHRAFEGAVPLILRGIPADQLDKGSSAFGQEGRRRSPHSCLQEFLNADDSANWGLLLSGDRLRLLHDNPSLVKPAYLQVDLELLVEGELFDEFATLWLLLHASCFRHPQTGSCVLDTWKEQAQEAGERVLGQLRHGVQQALEALGNGLLQHPDNDEMRVQLASGALSGAELHRQLLRLVYRFLFLFTAEDRDLLFPRSINQDDARRRIYREGYSVGRLRELAIRRSASEGPYGDLWQTQKLVFLQLRQSSSPLGLPGLGGLFNAPQCQALEACELGNRFLLLAMRAIGWFQAGDVLTRVNYRDLNTEELGSVYEGLLELHPQLERRGGSWQLSYGGGAGSDRKTTGSYYTPDQLVQLLIVSALLPVIADRLSKATTREEKEAALLAIRVLDPACGSGHFLLAAARRLALELARIRAEDEEPSEELRQQCLRDVVAHCIYGVDKNPMAVELCKVALWIEAIEPGKPLSFLDAHIQCGDSLVGVFNPKVLEHGISDDAYKPLPSDDRHVCSALKHENAKYRKAARGPSGGLQGSLNLSGGNSSSEFPGQLQAIEAMPEDSLEEISAKQKAYSTWLQDSGSSIEKLTSDISVAPFFLAKSSDTIDAVPTSEHIIKLQIGRSVDNAELIAAVLRASEERRFFHWNLCFGDTFRDGGFDCILGNPPWVSLSGRQAVKDPMLSSYLTSTYPSISSWPSLHPCFLMLGISCLRDRGRCGFVLPSQMFEQDSYRPTLDSASSLGGHLVDIVDIGEDAFPGVTQSCSLLSVLRTSAPAQPWHIKSSVSTGGAGALSEGIIGILQELETFDKFPKETFSDPGIHTGNISKRVIVSRDSASSYNDDEPSLLRPEIVREGKQIAPYYLSPGAKLVLTGYNPSDGEYWTIRERARYSNVPIVIRQTAARPIAALHLDPTYFRNSILACSGHKYISNRVLVCILNSSLTALFHRSKVSESGQKAFPQIKIKHLRNLPAPRSQFLSTEQGRDICAALEELHDNAAAAARDQGELGASLLNSIDERILQLYQLDASLAVELKRLLEEA